MAAPEDVRFAALVWSDHTKPGGVWTLSLVTAEGEQSGNYLEWDEGAGLPSLLDRYDALASLGFTVVEGGPEGWRWKEQMDDAGKPLLGGLADIRPLAAAEVLADSPDRPRVS